MKDPRRCVITSVHFDRPDYTRASLDALARCEGIADCLYVARVEPGSEEVIEAVRGVGFCEARVVVNPRRLRCAANTVAALGAGFARGDFVIHVEDDILLAPDALDYFRWARDRYRDDPAVATVSAYHRQAEEPGPAEYHDVRRRVWFHPWGWGTWRDRWRSFLRAPAREAMAVDVLPGRGDWDINFSRLFVSRGLHEVYPRLSRAQNIGARSSIHSAVTFTPEWHRAHQHCPHWAGDGRPVPPGLFREV